MKVVAGRAALAASGEARRPLALVIGNFDGVHLGHQALLHAARERAAAAGGDVGVLTFDPHPAKLFAPALAPPLIVSLRRRIELLGEAGADLVVVEPFTKAFASIEAPDFVREVLARDLSARDVVVGYDFSFGRERKGDTRLLAVEGAALGIGVTIVPPVMVSGLTCSSTKVREFALEGRVEGAAMLLGRPLEVTGEVVHGAGRGRGIGIPTANVKPEGELLPRPGIYAGRAVILDDENGGERQPRLRAQHRHQPDVHWQRRAVGCFVGRGAPARLRRRPLRPARAPGDRAPATRRAALRVDRGARGTDSRRLRRDAPGDGPLMFETETMAELCLKQGLVRDALVIYRRLLAAASDEGTRARRALRIAELELRDSGPHAVPAQTPATDVRARSQTRLDARLDIRQVTFDWRLPAGTPAPALQILVLRREETGISAERRTVRLPDAEGTLSLPIARIHSLRAAAGRLEGDRFVPLVRLDPGRLEPDSTD